MRSKLVNHANGSVQNRFMLCHLTAGAARKLHHNSAPVHQSINDALVMLADGKPENQISTRKPQATDHETHAEEIVS